MNSSSIFFGRCVRVGTKCIAVLCLRHLSFVSVWLSLSHFCQLYVIGTTKLQSRVWTRPSSSSTPLAVGPGGGTSVAGSGSPSSSMLARPLRRPATSRKEPPPLFSFGVITDIQYADIPDGRSFLGVPRYYRHSIAVLRRAVQSWNAHGGISFCLNLGDIVDGFCPKDRSLAAVQAVVREFDGFRGGPVYHMLGNHCLYNLPRSDLVSALRMPATCSPERAYYDFSPAPGHRFVVLDAYDFSAVGWPQGHPVSAAARRFLDARNPNDDKNSPSGLEGADRRFVMFNGGVGEAQLRWLDAALRRAARRRERVVVCSHLPVHPGAVSPTGLMWNYEEVRDVIHAAGAGGCVVACLAGHFHTGGYAVDGRGVHHRTLEAALECPPGTDAFGYVEVYPDRLRLVGSGRMKSTEMPLLLLNAPSSSSSSPSSSHLF